MNNEYIFTIYDDDIKNIVYTDIYNSKLSCYNELKDVLLSFEKLPDEKDDLNLEDVKNILSQFTHINLEEKSYSYWLPGNHRLIHIQYVQRLLK